MTTTRTIKDPLTYGVYETTCSFRAIEKHACVFYPDDMDLVAVTGRAGDPLSEQYAELFARAPAMKMAIELILRQAFHYEIQKWLEPDGSDRERMDRIVNICRSMLGDDYQDDMSWLKELHGESHD